MKLMVIGGGGREHAIIKKLKENPAVEKIYCLPGNGGIAADAVCVSEIGAKDIPAQVEFAKAHGIDYAVVAPDDPLALGAVDALSAAGIPCFGPDKKAAVIEASKVFAKDLMQKYNIPTAKYRVFTDAPSACAYIDAEGAPIVVKADGLALGKGVVVAQTVEEAKAAVRAMIEDKTFGQSGARVVIEEYMEGPEVSVLSFTDGEALVPMVSSMDHKRALDGDKLPQHRRHGRGRAEPVLYKGACGGVHGEYLPADDPRDARRGPPLPRLPLLRADAHQERPEGRGVQLPLRRPRNAGGAAAAQKRPAHRHAGDDERYARGRERGIFDRFRLLRRARVRGLPQKV